MLWQVSHKVIKLSGELPPVFVIQDDEHLKPCLLIYLCNICIYDYLYTKRIHVHSRSLIEHPADIQLLLSQDFLFSEYRNSQPRQRFFPIGKTCAVLQWVLNGIPVLTSLTEAAIFPYVSDLKILLFYIVISLNVGFVSFPFGLINFQLNLFSVPLCIQKELYPLLLLITLHSHNRYQSLMKLPEFHYFSPLLIEQ